MGKIVTTQELSEARAHRSSGPSRLSKPVTRTVISLSVAAAFGAVAMTSAHAAGLGRLTVKSGLGQPLKAEVEVTSLTEDEATSLSARLASSDAFRQAGLEFNPALTGLQFKINRTSGGRAAVEITSSRPINEPFVDLLVELNWASGKFVREYTFLLDPPELRLGQNESVAGGAALVTPAPVPSQPVATAQPRPTARPAMPAPAQAAAPVSPVSPAPAASPAVAAAPAAAAAQAPAPAAGSSRPSVVSVVRGDTLGDIARRFQPGSATLEQAIVAIYRANPDAFFGSVHQLRAGTQLVIPPASEMTALSSADVRAEMRASNQTWREYRARLASTTRATTKITAESQGSSAASGTVSEAPTDISPATDNGDQLKLSRDSDTASAVTGGAGSATAVENSIARDSALQEAQSRVTELERNVKDLQRLLELKNKQLADLSDQVETLETQQPTQPAQPVEAPAAATDTEALPAADATGQAAGSDDGTQSTPLPTVADTDSSSATEATTASDTSAESTADPAASAAAAATAAAQQASTAGADEPKPAATVETAQPAAQPEPAPTPVSWLDSIMSNPLVPIGLTGLIALIGGLFFWRRRKGKEELDEFEDTVGAEDAFAANSLFGTTGGQDVDTSNSLFQTEAGTATATDSTVDVHSTEVDPIAEAEVYIAYGREAQAEEILKEALKRQPERQAIRLKLLEIYAGRKDATAFSSLAREMYDMTSGQNEEWPKVITMGLAIDPDNALYTGDADGIAPEDFPTTTMAPTESSDKGGKAAGAAGLVAGAAGASALVDALSSDPQDDNPAADDNSIDMKMPDTLASAPSVQDEPSVSAEADSDELGSLDFDLDISTEMDPQPDTMAAVSDTAIGMDTGLALDASDDKALNDAISNSVEMPSLEFGTADKEPDAIADLDMDIPSLDTPAGTAEAVDTDVDLSAIGLDLEPSSGSDAAPAGGEPARWQEMATKLDLASAYEEIGDKEGARELLDEVIKGGDNAQQQKARAMLSKIS